MKVHAPIRVLALGRRPAAGGFPAGTGAADPLVACLSSMPHLQVEPRVDLPEELGGFDVVVTEGGGLTDPEQAALERFVRAGGGWLAFADGPSATPLPPVFGVQPATPLPPAEVRALLTRPAEPFAARLAPATCVAAIPCALDRDESVDVDVLASIDWQYRRLPVLVRRPLGAGALACTTLGGTANPGVLQLLYRVVRVLAGNPPEPTPVRAGLVGYPSWVGRVHGEGIRATPGLELRAVADLDGGRRVQAGLDYPGARLLDSGDALADDPDIDLVIVTTPPDSHARISLRMLAAGKHVVCEKPLALSTAETEAMAAEAADRGLHLGCHQNRRWDVDYLAIRRARDEGLLGEIFHVETFVGGFVHPCGQWHSHAAVSGGTAYDWGAHYLDWIVSLIPDSVESVTGFTQKRVWHDVTNADQERIGIRFTGGQEAEFLHSDIAAARKPKWYVLGTAGAVVGHWRDESSLEPDPVAYYHRHEYPATEVPPDLALFRRHPSGQILAQAMALPPRDHHGFHRNLADHLLTGEPLMAPLEDSMKVVAILEAAARSAGRGGVPERIRR